MMEKGSYHDFAMTQQEVADAFGTSRANLACIEAQAKENFKKAMSRLGYDIKDLLED